jgi:hypothetical protein
LKVARAGPKQDTRLMAIGAHARDDIGSSVIQVEQNIASIAPILVSAGRHPRDVLRDTACAWHGESSG